MSSLLLKSKMGYILSMLIRRKFTNRFFPKSIISLYVYNKVNKCRKYLQIWMNFCAFSFVRALELDLGFPVGASGKEPACQCRRHKRHGFNPRVRKMSWGRAWQPVFLPGEFHGQKSLAGNSPQGCRVGHDEAIEQASKNQVYQEIQNPYTYCVLVKFPSSTGFTL